MTGFSATLVVILLSKLSNRYSHKINSGTTVEEADVPLRPLTSEKSMRQVNRFVIEYSPDISARVDNLLERKALADDPEVIRLASDVIDRIPETAFFGMKQSRHLIKTAQAEKVEKLLKRKTGGFFIECGARDGEFTSNTVWIENTLGWTGLLVEINPFYYTQLLGKNRRVHSINACLSLHKHISSVRIDGSGQLTYETKPGEKQPANSVEVPCFPLMSILAAINQTKIDYFSLDIEGAELDVLKTIDWTLIDIDVLTVEHLHIPAGKKALSDYMESVGYSKESEINIWDKKAGIHADDTVFVKKKKTGKASETV